MKYIVYKESRHDVYHHVGLVKEETKKTYRLSHDDPSFISYCRIVNKGQVKYVTESREIALAIHHGIHEAYRNREDAYREARNNYRERIDTILKNAKKYEDDPKKPDENT